MKKISSSKKMSIKTNEKNISAFKELLPSFFYGNDTNERIIKTISGENIEAFNASYYMDLQANDRLFIEIPKNADNDSAFQYFLKTIARRNIDENTIINDNGVFLRLDLIPNSGNGISYQNFIDNKIETPEISGKLFKALVKKAILLPCELDTINKLKVNEKVFFCISRNIIDFLFASTHQNYTSCLNLESEYDASYYMSLPAMILDPNRYICFITDGKLSKHTIKDTEFKHFKYLQRAWCLAMNDGGLFIERNYPAEKISFSDCFDFLGFHSYGYHNNLNHFKNDEIQSLYSFKPAQFEDGADAMIYLDSVGLNRKNNLFFYDSTLSSTKGIESPDFCYKNGFNALDDFEELGEQNTFICTDCGNSYGISDAYENNHGTFCQDCYSNYYSCDDCGCSIHSDDTYSSESGDVYCFDCYNRLSTTCCECADRIIMDDSEQLQNNSEDFYLCNHCYRNSEYIQCENCGNQYPNEHSDMEKVGDLDYCCNCAGDFIQCDICLEVHPKTETKTIDNEVFCLSCYESAIELPIEYTGAMLPESYIIATDETETDPETEGDL